MMTHVGIAVLYWLLAAADLSQTVYTGVPDWISGDTRRGTGGALVDLDCDGWRDLFAADNTQLGVPGRFRQYTGIAGGFFERRMAGVTSTSTAQRWRWPTSTPMACSTSPLACGGIARGCSLTTVLVLVVRRAGAPT
jgi:hypothetical protein